MSNAPRLTVGYVAGAHGLAGLVRVQLHDADSQSVRPGAELVLTDQAQQGREVGRYRVDAVERAPGKDGRLRVRLAGVDDREQAESLTRMTIEVDRDALPPLQDDEFYLADALGLAVRRIVEDGSMQELGRVVGSSSNGSQDLFEVQWHDEGGQVHEWLLPALPQFVRDVDDERILVDVPAGFLPDALESES
jgi:16S rRNA processing protein RimM